jgi:hypothetical protein
LKGEGVELAAHAAAERLENELVLLDAGEAAERRANDGSGIMIAIACQILNAHLGIRECVADQVLDLGSGHGHVRLSLICKNFYFFFQKRRTSFLQIS